jgi:hypothetical protein
LEQVKVQEQVRVQEQELELGLEVPPRVALERDKELEKEGPGGGGLETELARDEEAPVQLVQEKGQEGAREVSVPEARGKGLGPAGALGVVPEGGDPEGVVLEEEGAGLEGAVQVGCHLNMVKIQNLPILWRPNRKDTREKSC